MIGARLHHASLSVAALDPAVAFFETVFGYAVEVREDGMTDIAVMAGEAGLSCDFVQMRGPAGGVVLEVICFHRAGGAMAADAAPWRPGAGHVAFHVADFDAALRACAEAGAEVIGAPIDWPGGRAAYLKVPGGAFVEIEWLKGQG
ncbi:VOC family protein [Pseudooceanicola sp. 502str34]